MAKRWIGIVFIVLVACGAGISEAAKPIPLDWRTYENQNLGISLRLPPLMSVHTGADAAFQGYIPWSPRPDIRLALPGSSFQGTNISEAVVAIYAPWSGDCPPPYLPDKPDTQVVANRPFYHWTDGEGATGHTISGENFCTIYRGKPFVISVVIQTYRDDEERTEDFVKRAGIRSQKITALLMQVLKTLVLTDPVPKQK